jgi:hypothetical protein
MKFFSVDIVTVQIVLKWLVDRKRRKVLVMLSYREIV